MSRKHRTIPVHLTPREIVALLSHKVRAWRDPIGILENVYDKLEDALEFENQPQPDPPTTTPEPPPDHAELTDAEVRNAALCLMAADAALEDSEAPEQALARMRRIEEGLNDEPWRDGKHSGDCTKEPHTCIRCLIEQAEVEARARFNE